MYRKLREKQLAVVSQKGPILLHDNARPHVLQRTLQKLYELSYETVPHPRYSSDLSPTDYHFCKHLDNFLQEKIFNNQTETERSFNKFVGSRTPDI
jgi:hypothetical protein